MIRNQIITEEFSQLIKDIELKYLALYNRNAFGIFIHDFDGNFLDANNTLLQYLGYKKEEFLKLNIVSFLDGDELQKALKAIKSIIGKGTYSSPVEHRIRRKNGEYIWLNVEGALIYRNGNPYAIQVIAHDISAHKKAEESLRKRERDLESQKQNLEELNTALKVLLKKKEEDRSHIQGQISSNINELILPYLQKLKNTLFNKQQRTYMDIIETNLKEITSSFTKRLSAINLQFTPTEIQIANLVKQGKSSKEIANIIHVSPQAVSFHRNNIRKKLGLSNKKINLRSYLISSFDNSE
jgi:PAS domain S-box-containing protein